MPDPVVETERSLRIATVGEQANIEEALVKTNHVAAVFVVPDVLTPLYISRTDIFYDTEAKLYKISSPVFIPEGLIPAEKLSDADQLSTVLRRVLAVEEMLKRGVPIVVMHVNEKRYQAGDPQSTVDASVLEAHKTRYPNLRVIKIDAIPAGINAANYQCESGKVVSIGAAQIHQTGGEWGVQHQQSVDYMQRLDALLIANGQPTLDELAQSCPMLPGQEAQPQAAAAAARAAP